MQVGNKCDLANLRVIESQEAVQLAEQHNIAFIETSAYDSTGIDKAFETILSGIYTCILVHPIIEISKRIDAHDTDIRPMMPIPPYDSGLSPSPPESEKENYCGPAACCVVNCSCFLKTSQSVQAKITKLHRKIIFGDDNSIRTLGGIRSSSKIKLSLLGVVA